MSKPSPDCLHNCAVICPFCDPPGTPPPSTEHYPDCPKCETGKGYPDYGAVSWPDELIADEIKIEGKTPFNCDCGHFWYGEWKR